MGFTSVVIINNDRIHDVENNPLTGEMIRNAILQWDSRKNDKHLVRFPYGSVVSVDHNDNCQIVVVEGGRGISLTDCDNIDPHVLEKMRIILDKHGYTVTKI